jgi:hypothetical protein
MTKLTLIIIGIITVAVLIFAVFFDVDVNFDEMDIPQDTTSVSADSAVSDTSAEE